MTQTIYVNNNSPNIFSSQKLTISDTVSSG